MLTRRRFIAALAGTTALVSTPARAVRDEPPLGLRLLNPLLVERRGDVVWQGQSRRQRHRRFISFEHPVFGIRCPAIVLLNYEKRGLNTIEKIISSWAPASDGNDVNDYIESVSKRMKTPRNIVMHLHRSPSELGMLIEAMAWREIGMQLPWQAYPRPENAPCYIVMAGVSLAYSQWQPKPIKDIYTCHQKA